MVLDVVLRAVIDKAIDKGADALFKEEPKKEPKSNVGTLLTGAALGVGGFLALGALTGRSDEKERKELE
ncbi:MAG: hypothetical protein IIT66_04590, partial [Acetobacter sp.]|nr:hypothetical protein [Acetobacter sp.]